jgi:hypothetical protein
MSPEKPKNGDTERSKLIDDLRREEKKLRSTTDPKQRRISELIIKSLKISIGRRR